MGKANNYQIPKRWQHTNSPKQQADDFCSILAAEIVVGAIRDWRLLVSRRAWLEDGWRKVNFDELRLFFKSDWCAFLMQDFDIEPEAILQQLEAELRDAMQQQDRRQKQRRRRNK